MALGVMSTAANAETLDFTVNPFIGSNGTFAGTTYTISASGGTLTTAQSFDGANVAECFGLACTNDGLGVNNGGGNDDDDEISSAAPGQSITVDFGAVVNITGLAFLDLFTDDEGSNAAEVARVTYNGGSMDFAADAGQVRFDGSAGFLSASALNLFTNQLVFTVFNGAAQNRGYGDYALASIVGISAVPIPPALLMFGAALGFTGWLARRRKRSNNPF
tara:strand:- start:536 stop:1192 length:657 start_codon:yes stop_codon:yes gene_type:complete